MDTNEDFGLVLKNEIIKLTSAIIFKPMLLWWYYYQAIAEERLVKLYTLVLWVCFISIFYLLSLLFIYLFYDLFLFCFWFYSPSRLIYSLTAKLTGRWEIYGVNQVSTHKQKNLACLICGPSRAPTLWSGESSDSKSALLTTQPVTTCLCYASSELFSIISGYYFVKLTLQTTAYTVLKVSLWQGRTAIY